MTGQVDKKAEKIMCAYFDYIGEQHLENICSELDMQNEEIEGIQVPESMDDWFNRYMDGYRKKESRDRHIRKIRKTTSKAAIILFVLLTSMLIVTLSVDAIRTRVLNFIIESNEKYTGIRVDDEPVVDIKWKDYYYPVYLPQGFHINETYELKNQKIIRFINDEGQDIVFTQSVNGTEVQLDTEEGIVSEVLINGNAGILSEKPGKNILLWHNEEYSLWLNSKIDSEVLIRIAESVIKK